MVLDVRAKDENGRIFDIEIQVENHRAFKELMLGYWADTYSGQLLRGDKYIALKPVISIIIKWGTKRYKVGHCFYRVNRKSWRNKCQ